MEKTTKKHWVLEHMEETDRILKEYGIYERVNQNSKD